MESSPCSKEGWHVAEHGERSAEKAEVVNYIILSLTIDMIPASHSMACRSSRKRRPWLRILAVAPMPIEELYNGRAEFQTGEGAHMHIDRDAILAVLRGVEAAFSDADLERWLSFFHSPYLIMAPEGVIAPRSENEALAILRPQMEKLRSRGYAGSELRRASVKLLSTSTALAAVEWIRRKSNEEELERLGATYAFYKGDKGWQIVMVTVHSPATLVELK